MSQGWDSLPLLPLRCILDHLSTEDALAATSTCRHWRTALLLYEGHKDTLRLRVKDLEKILFLSRLFRKHTKRLHIYLDCSDDQLQKFRDYVLPQFFDAVKLQEIIFIGPSYMQLSHQVPVKLKRIVTESLVFKHLHSLKTLALMGCEMGTAMNENERYTHRLVEYYSRPLLFSSSPSAADAIFTRCNVNIMLYSTLQHIIVDYDHVSTEAIESLAHLNMFSHLSLNVCAKRNLTLRPIQWHRLREVYGTRLNVTINIISLPYRKFNDVIENVLVEGLPLMSLKVMFCKTIKVPLLEHVIREYRESLQELVWADAPFRAEGSRNVQNSRQSHYDMCDVNPFMMLCWQCSQLKRLAVHGYWLWQYDVVGFVRLRPSLRHLEISSVYDRPGRLVSNQAAYGGAAICRVLVGDSPVPPDKKYINQVNEFAEFKYSPMPWSGLHPGLRPRAPASQRAAYVLHELTAHTLGVT